MPTLPPSMLALVRPFAPLFAHRRLVRAPASVRQAAWYPKARPTFVDAPALLRRELRAQRAFSLSAPEPDLIKVPRAFVEHVTETLCYAA